MFDEKNILAFMQEFDFKVIYEKEEQKMFFYGLMAKAVHVIYEWMANNRINTTVFTDGKVLNAIKTELAIAKKFKEVLRFLAPLKGIPQIRPDVLVALGLGERACIVPTHHGPYKIYCGETLVPVHGTPADLYKRICEVLEPKPQFQGRKTEERPIPLRSFMDKVVIRESEKGFLIEYRESVSGKWEIRYSSKLPDWKSVEKELESSIYKDETYIVNDTAYRLECPLTRNPYLQKIKKGG